MPEPKDADTNRRDAVAATAVMPCVGGFIFYVGQSRAEDRPDFGNRNANSVAMAADATDADNERIA